MKSEKSLDKNICHLQKFLYDVLIFLLYEDKSIDCFIVASSEQVHLSVSFLPDFTTFIEAMARIC